MHIAIKKKARFIGLSLILTYIQNEKFNTQKILKMIKQT